MENINVRRIIDRLDAFLNRNDCDGAERLLDYWLGQAQEQGDLRSELSLRNEAMGLARKLGKKEKAVSNGERALEITGLLNMENTVSGGTTLVNAATVYKAFGMASRAIPLYEKAEKIYKETLGENDERLGGLYNNYALALADCGMYEEADGYYVKALTVMEKVPGGEPERAVTLLNMADCEVMSCGRKKTEKATDLVLRAKDLLESVENRDGNYAFVCEKCAHVFGYYGLGQYGKELENRAREIYGNG